VGELRWRKGIREPGFEKSGYARGIHGGDFNRREPQVGETPNWTAGETPALRGAATFMCCNPGRYRRVG
jgi:hypothetical protein